MNGIMGSNGFPGFINGKLTKNDQGELVLTTESRSIPVRLEGASIPLGKEVVFKFLRAEPGRLLLTPLSQWESLEENLPFLKNIPLAERGEWEALIKAAVQEKLPLDQDVISAMRKWSLTAEKSWGVKVAPEVFAFLIRKGLPVAPATALWALYVRYPSVQKEVWRQFEAAEGGTHTLGETDFQGKSMSAQDILDRLQELIKALTKTGAESLPLGKAAMGKDVHRMKEALTHPQQSAENANTKNSENASASQLHQGMEKASLYFRERPAGGNKGTIGGDKLAAQSEDKTSAVNRSREQGQAYVREKTGARVKTTLDTLLRGAGQQESADTQELKESLSKAGALRSRPERGNIDPREMWTEILQGSSRFLAGPAQGDKALAQFIFCLFPHEKQEIRWEAWGGDEAKHGDRKGYSFRLTYNSQALQEVEVVGALSKDGLDLLIGVEKPEDLQPHFANFKSFLTGLGWRVNRIQVIKTSADEKGDPIPQRVDGWV